MAAFPPFPNKANPFLPLARDKDKMEKRTKPFRLMREKDKIFLLWYIVIIIL